MTEEEAQEETGHPPEEGRGAILGAAVAEGPATVDGTAQKGPEEARRACGALGTA